MYGPVDLLEKYVLFEYLNHNITLDPFDLIRKCCVDSVNIRKGYSYGEIETSND